MQCTPTTSTLPVWLNQGLEKWLQVWEGSSVSLAFFLSLSLQSVSCGGGFCEVHVYYLGTTQVARKLFCTDQSVVTIGYPVTIHLIWFQFMLGRLETKHSILQYLWGTTYVLCPVLRSLARDLFKPWNFRLRVWCFINQTAHFIKY